MKKLRVVLNNKEGQVLYSKTFEGRVFAYVEGNNIKVINIDHYPNLEDIINLTNEVHSYSIYNY